MHSKLSMRNLHTFGQLNQDNNFMKSRSISSNSKNQTGHNTEQISNPFLRQNLHQKPNQYQRSQIQYNTLPLRENTNTQAHFNRPNSNIKEDQYAYKVSPQKHEYSSVSPLRQAKSNRIQRVFPDTKIHNYSCDQIIHLLKNQYESLEKVKQTVENDKNRIQKHFGDFKQSVNNVIDDLKLTICSTIDSQYQHFVNQFRNVKIQYTNYCNIKRQFWHHKEGQIQKAQKNSSNVSTVKYPGMINPNGKVENQALLTNLIQDLKDCKKHINYKQFQEIQEKLLKPLLLTTKNMVKQMNIQSYYKPEIAYDTFALVHRKIQKDMNGLHERMDLFINDYLKEKIQTDQQDYEKSLQKQKYNQFNHHSQAPTKRYTSPSLVQHKINKQNKNICSPRQVELSYGSFKKQGHLYMNKKNNVPSHLLPEKFQQEEVSPMTTVYNKQKYSSTAHTTHSGHTQFNTKNHNKKSCYDQIKQNIPVCHNSYPTFSGGQDVETERVQFNGQKLRKNKYNHRWSMQDGEKLLNSIPKIKLQQLKPIVDKSYKRSQSEQETALCVSYLYQCNKLAVGTKGGSVKIFCTKTGTKLQQYKQNKSSVCSLSSVISDNAKNIRLLASGGDVGCCSVVLWDLNRNQSYHGFTGHHTAAVCSIIDMNDSKHFLSGGFDNLINVYNWRKKQLVKSVDTNEKIILLAKIRLKLNKKQDEQYILSGHLSGLVCVWEVKKNSFNTVVSLEQVRKINIGTVPYSIISLSLKQIMINGKDNWVRVIDTSKGSIQRAGQIGHFEQIIKLQLQSDKVELDKYSNGNILNQIVCIGCRKDGSLALIQGQANQQIQIQHQIGSVNALNFSCGIGPTTSICVNQQLCNSSSIYGVMYRPHHKNKQQTQIRQWCIKISRNQTNEERDYHNCVNTY